MAKIVCYIFSIISTSVLALYLHYSAQRSWRLPPVPAKVLPAQKVQLQTGIDSYGRYSFVLDPSASIDGLLSRQQEWRPIPFNELTYTRFEEKEFSIVLDCHKCYGDSPEFQKCDKVSGGTLKVTFENSEWVLGFHHVGAESVFYSDDLPPQELMNWLSECNQDFQQSSFVSLFESLYAAVKNNQSDEQKVAARNVTCKLIQTFASRFGSCP